MAITSAWTRKAKLTIPIASVPGDQTDFPVMLIWNGTSGNIPLEIYNAGGYVKSDGSDIRFTSDAAGNTELAFEIVTFSPNDSVGSARVKIWVKIPSVSSATPTTFYMWWENAAATAYAVTDTYGRNNVWTSSYLGVWHLNELSGATATNSVGSNNGTYTGTTFPNRVDATYGYMQGFVNANGNYVSIGTGSPWQVTGSISMSAIVTVTAWTTAWQAIIAKGDNAYRLSRNSSNNYPSAGRDWSGGEMDATNTTVINSGYHLVGYVYDNTAGTRCYVDGSSGTLNTTTTATNSNTDNLCIGRNTIASNRDWNGYIGEVKIVNAVRSSTWVTTEYNTTIGFATFIAYGLTIITSNNVFPFCGWTRKCLLTVDYTKVGGNFVGFPIPLVWNGSSGNIPAEVYNNSSTSPMSDGRDIRFTYDAAGTRQIPFEIVTFTPNSTVANARVEIWVKLNLSSSTNTLFYIWYGNSQAQSYSVTNTYGRNNVWNSSQAALIAVYHMDGSGDATDSTGNNRTLTNSGSAASTTALGTARDFTAVDRDYLYATAFSGNPAVQGFSALVEVDSVDTYSGSICSDRDCVAMGANASGQPQGFYYQGASVWNTINIPTDIRGAGLRLLTYGANPSASIQRMMLNGGSEVDGTDPDAISYSGLGTQFTVGRHGNGSTTHDYDGRIDELWVFNYNQTATWNLTEYNSKIGFATFITASTPENVEGIKYDNASTGSSTASATITFSHTIGNAMNRLLTVGIAIESTSLNTVSSVTYNGVAMTQVGTVNVLSSTFYMIIYLFQMLETSLPRGGAYSVVVTINAAPSSGAVAGAISLWNVDQRGYQVTASNTITSNDVISVSITPNAYNSWIVSCVGSNAVGTYTATAPLVERYDYGAAGPSCTSSGGTMPDVSPVSTTVTETFVTGSARQAIFAATFPPHIYTKYGIFELGMNF